MYGRVLLSRVIYILSAIPLMSVMSRTFGHSCDMKFALEQIDPGSVFVISLMNSVVLYMFFKFALLSADLQSMIGKPLQMPLHHQICICALWGCFRGGVYIMHVH